MNIESVTVSIRDAEGFTLYTAEAPTREAAIGKLLDTVREDIVCEVKVAGLLLPECVMLSEHFPQDVPAGTVLVVLETISHSTGDAYKWRCVAVPPDTKLTCEGTEYEVGSGRVVSFVDSNSEYTFGLPKGSFLCTRKGWQPATEVRYHY